MIVKAVSDIFTKSLQNMALLISKTSLFERRAKTLKMNLLYMIGLIAPLQGVFNLIYISSFIGQTRFILKGV